MPPLKDLVQRIRQEKNVTRCSYRLAKPCRIYFRYMVGSPQGVAVQLFPNGCIQILGNHSTEAIVQVYLFLRHYCDLTLPTIKSCTIQCHWDASQVNLARIPSNRNISNERELFPSVLISHCENARVFHCSLFQNGKVIVTGVTSIPEAETILQTVLSRYILPHRKEHI